jgi:SAM-dependent methyltransferase
MVVKWLARCLIDGLLVRRLRGPYAREEGVAWAVHLPELAHLGDDASNPRRCPLALYENGVALRPAHSPHIDVRTIGRGAFSFWGGRLLFSASDNSDPNTNGRAYTYSVARWLYRRRTYLAPQGEPLPPVNHRRRDASPAQIRADVAYTLQSSAAYLHHLRKFMPSLTGKAVLELGPGINFGVVMVLAAYGAKPAVADPFLAPWDDDYHPKYYAALADAVARGFAGADVRGLRTLVEARGYPPEVIARYECAVEELTAPSESADIVFSNAVGEHLADVGRAFQQIYRVTRPGGVGLHQVDFRDHRNFDLPLEFLVWEEDVFREDFKRNHGEHGNRWRPDEMAEFMRAAGFEVVSFEGNLFCTPEYLAELIPRLRVARSRYRERSPESLRTLSGFYRLRKPAEWWRRAGRRLGFAFPAAPGISNPPTTTW